MQAIAMHADHMQKGQPVHESGPKTMGPVHLAPEYIGAWLGFNGEVIFYPSRC
jgi:hypothetical protein